MRHRIPFSFMSLWLVACGPDKSLDSDGESAEENADDVDTTEPSPECTLPAGCDPPMADGYVLEGWFTQTDSTQIFVSQPGTACGNTQAKSCNSCGNYDSVDIVLPGEPTVGQIYMLDVDPGVGILCGSWISDCMGNGGGEGGGTQDGQIEILTVTDTCITGTLESDCGDLTFQAARCD